MGLDRCFPLRCRITGWPPAAAAALVGLVCLASPGAAGCDGCLVSARGIQAYAESVCRAAGGQLTVERCEMAQIEGRMTRLGYCLVDGAADGAARLSSRLRLSVARKTLRDDWAASHNSACALSGWIGAHPRARLLPVPRDRHLPGNHQGAVLEGIWIDGRAICFDLQYPWS